MARAASAERDEAMVIIREHLATKGEDGLMEIWEGQFPQVKRATWYSWIANAKKRPVSPEAIEEARQLLKRSIDDPNLLRGAIATVVPPAPVTLAEIGPHEARRSLNLFARYEQVWKDAELLRAHSLKVINDEEAIKLLKSFIASANMRISVLRDLMTAQEKLWNMRQMQEFHDAIVDEVAKESPECAARIIARISDLSVRCGMTMEARV